MGVTNGTRECVFLFSHLLPGSVEEIDLALIQYFSPTQQSEEVALLSIQEKEFSEFRSDQLSLSPTQLAHLL